MAASGVKNPPPHHDWCHTHVKGYIPFSYMWTIRNFRLRTEKHGESLESSIFSAGTNNEKVELQLSVYPMGEKDGDENNVSLYLCIFSSNHPEVNIDCRISILNAQQVELRTLRFRHRMKKPEGWGWPCFISRDKAFTLLRDDDLTLLCKGSIIQEGSFNTSGTNNIVKFVVPECAALDNLGELLESGKLTDITFIACGEEIQAHKAILAARNAVFSAMFNCDSEQAKKNKVEISDTEPKVLREILRFIYTGKAPNLEGMAAAMIVAADKYNLPRLKVMCAEVLFKSLSSDNAANNLILADELNGKQLKVRTLDFIILNLERVINTPSFKIMANSYPHLIDKILRRTTGQKQD